MTKVLKDSKYTRDVEILKEWYSKQPHLPQNIGEEYFYNFVTGTKTLEKAKQKIDSYFTSRKKLMDMLENFRWGTKTFEDHLLAVDAAILPGTTKEGYRVVFMKSRKEHVDKFQISSTLLLTITMVEMAMSLWPEETSYVVIHDGKYNDVSWVKQLDIKHIAAFGKFVLNAMPVRMKTFCMINSPVFVDKFVSLAQVLFPKKLSDRMHFPGDDSMLKKLLPEEMIPKEYGGSGKSLHELNEYWKKEIESRRGWFEEKLKLFSDESKRPKDSRANEVLDFGVDGSFKTLQID